MPSQGCCLVSEVRSARISVGVAWDWEEYGLIGFCCSAFPFFVDGLRDCPLLEEARIYEDPLRDDIPYWRRGQVGVCLVRVG